MEIGVDVRPHGSANVINLNGNGVFRVAILSDESFNALDVDRSSVRLGDPALDGKASPIRFRVAGVNHDGRPDLIAVFRIRDLLKDGAIYKHTSQLTLTATLRDGTTITGSDSVRVKTG